MARFSRRKKRPVQKGVNAIFSVKIPRRSVTTKFDDTIEEEIVSGQDVNKLLRTDVSGRRGRQVHFSRILVAAVLIGLGISLIGSGFFVGSGSQHVLGSSSGGPGPSPPVRVAHKIAPSFYAIANVAEMIVQSGGSYTGASGIVTGDFLVVQIAYSEGSPGNLPDIYSVGDSFSNSYNRAASATPGVETNFWEQVWTGKSVSSSASTRVTVTPDWAGCLAPCVSSIIITMTIALYRDVAGIGVSTIIAPNASSTSQAATISPTQSGSVLVELLSHGAYNNCGTDQALPGNGQASRNCFTGTTERTEFFDHLISNTRMYSESFSWSQVEVQRGIYLELVGIETF